MKKHLLFILILTISLAGKAQIWCTPNSLWHFNTSQIGFNSAYTKQTYLYDTLVGGVTFNKIKTEKYSISMSGQSYHLSYLYTSAQNNVVFFNSTNTPTIAATDTLMYFGPIGSKWRVKPNGGTSCAQSFIEITDAGPMNVQGQNLMWRKVNYTNYYMFGTPNQYTVNGTDTIFERIGYKDLAFQFLGHCSEVVDVSTAKFRCFQDNQLNMTSGTQPCNYTTGINENKLNSFSFYPNPANTTLTIVDEQNNFKNATIEIKNQLGQIVLSVPFTTQLNVSQLKAGVYFLSLQNNYVKFIKE